MQLIYVAAVCFWLLASCKPPRATTQINRAEPWMLPSFIKQDAVNPIMEADTTAQFEDSILKQQVKWIEKDVFNPAAVVRNDTVFLLFRAEDKIGKYAGTSRVGLAWSLDGIRFTKHPTPVLYPDNDAFKKWEWEGGCEDPRVVQDEGGTYFMTYSSYDGDKARMMIASSTDISSQARVRPIGSGRPRVSDACLRQKVAKPAHHGKAGPSLPSV